MNVLYLFRLRLCIYLSMITIATTVACSCAWVTPEHFCRSILETNYVILGVVLEKSQWYSMEVQVLEDIHLQSDEDTISILGQDGFNCGEWLEDFLVGDTLILGLGRGTFYEIETNEQYEWFLGNCGLYYLRYSNGIVEGGIDFEAQSQSYEDFKSGIMNCINLSSSTKDYLDNEDIALLPNPTNGHLDILIENSNRIEYTFDIIDITGKVVLPSILVQDLRTSIDLTDLNSGVYFLRSRNTLKVVTERFVKI